MDPLKLIKRIYSAHPEAEGFLLGHCRAVAEKALSIAQGLSGHKLDIRFIEEAALLHDVGILMTYAPALGCRGAAPYVQHGIIGSRMLSAEGLTAHALLCERHVGVGLTEEDARKLGFPGPVRDMTPQSLEEIIVCYADKFFTKALMSNSEPHAERPLKDVRGVISTYGEEKIRVFDGWTALLSP